MADSFLINVADRVLGMLTSSAIQEVRQVWGLDSDLKQLQVLAEFIHAVLLDAEEKQGTNHQIGIWLKNLKDIFYDAEDVLDEFECEALRRQVVKRGSITRKVGRFFSRSNPIAFRFQMAHKIKKISERCVKLFNNGKMFKLTKDFAGKEAEPSERNMTHSHVNPSDVIGRDVDREKIVKLLMNASGAKNVSVISIVGIGGVGKTTLAKFVYNDVRVIEHFQPLKMWICVSTKFNIKKLIQELLSAATKSSVDKYVGFSMDQLQTDLRKHLYGKKFLLVLDDVWNDDVGKWADFEELLQGGASGSKILVTTRNNLVAFRGADSKYNLSGLPHDNCMSVFKKLAFQEGQEKQYPNLLKIGNQIVDKCGRIPLAVTTLGRLLAGKTDEHTWTNIRDNKIWELQQSKNDILPALRLSYDMMPVHLKPCFAYCSLFPKKHVYSSDSLVAFWMSHGLIKLEDDGLQNFKELCSRSFFQDVTEWGFFLSAEMHDLLHDLGLSILKGELSTMSFHSPDTNTSENARHLSFSDTPLNYCEGPKVPPFLNKLGSVRTILFQYRYVGATSRSFVDTCISRFKSLRVLKLTYSTFEVLPRSIGNLKQLRHLELTGSHRIKKLPNSICKLQQLQFLGVLDCCELEELPRDIGNLICLRTLHLTTKQKSLPQKNGIGCLTSLRVLVFYKCLNLEYLFEGKPHLTSLQTLFIDSCENLISLPLHGITTLKNLTIRSCEKLDLMTEEGNHGYEELTLRCLHISDLPVLKALPQWLQGSASTLQFLRIDGCHDFTTLPDWLPNFTSLLELLILHCPNLLCLPEGTDRLSALRELEVADCPTLIRRCKPEKGEDWLKIANVPKICLEGRMISRMITPTV